MRRNFSSGLPVYEAYTVIVSRALILAVLSCVLVVATAGSLSAQYAFNEKQANINEQAKSPIESAEPIPYDTLSKIHIVHIDMVDLVRAKKLKTLDTLGFILNIIADSAVVLWFAAFVYCFSIGLRKMASVKNKSTEERAKLLFVLITAILSGLLVVDFSFDGVRVFNLSPDLIDVGLLAAIFLAPNDIRKTFIFGTICLFASCSTPAFLNLSVACARENNLFQLWPANDSFG